MSGLLGIAASYVANAVWEVALITAVAWLTTRLLKRLGPQAEHAVWVAALMMSVVTPALPLLPGLIELAMPSRVTGTPAIIMFVATEGGATVRAGAFAVPIFWILWLLGCYAATIFYFAGRLAFRMHAASEMLRKAVPAALTTEQNQVWQNCERAFSLREAQIMTSAKLSGPVALAVRRPVLLLPSDFASGCMPQDFLAAVAHECAHLKRRDYQKNLFYEFESLLLAFHPLIAVIKSRIAQTREMICDEMAAEGHLEGGNYARSLLRLAAMVAVGPRDSGNYAVGIFDADILGKRIERIRMTKQHVGAATRYGLMISAVAILVSTLIGGAALAVPIMPEQPTLAVQQAHPEKSSQPSAHGHVYKVGDDVSAPVPLNSVVAKYSAEAKRAKYQGVCLVSLIVDAQGNPRNLRVIRPLGMGLDEKALEAVRKYRFKPAMMDGKSPVPVRITIEVNFRLY